jgi:hypothetical protein
MATDSPVVSSDADLCTIAERPLIVRRSSFLARNKRTRPLSDRFLTQDQRARTQLQVPQSGTCGTSRDRAG